MTNNETTLIISHSKIPKTRGLKPTDFSTFLDKPAPIKNNVRVRHFLDNPLM